MSKNKSFTNGDYSPHRFGANKNPHSTFQVQSRVEIMETIGVFSNPEYLNLRIPQSWSTFKKIIHLEWK